MFLVRVIEAQICLLNISKSATKCKETNKNKYVKKLVKPEINY